MKMTTKKLFWVGGLTFAIICTSIVYQQNQVNRAQSLSRLHNGVGTCFTRVAQTFTALMVNDLNSPYLSKDFKGLTSECFSEVNKVYKNIFGTKTVDQMTKNLNELTSDAHWFSERIEKTHSIQLNPEKSFNLTESNLITKYAELENIKLALQDGLDAKMTQANTNVEIANTIASLMLAIFVGLVGAIGWREQKAKNKSIQLEKVAQEMLAKNDLETYKVDRLIENILNTHGHTKAWEVFKNYHATLLEKKSFSYSENENTHYLESETQQEEDGVDFNEAFNAAFDQIKQTAFNHGIIIDFDFDQNLFVKADREALEQMFMTVISGAIEKSLAHNQGRKIILRSKALGGTAYFKVKVVGHLFNTSELEFVNSHDGEVSSVSTQTLLLKEIVNDMRGSLSFKNKINEEGGISGSEIEIGLIRTQNNVVEENKREIQNIVKGKKRDILRSFESEA